MTEEECPRDHEEEFSVNFRPEYSYQYCGECGAEWGREYYGYEILAPGHGLHVGDYVFEGRAGMPNGQYVITAVTSKSYKRRPMTRYETLCCRMKQSVYRLKMLGLKLGKIILDSGGRSVVGVFGYLAGLVLVIKMFLDSGTRRLIVMSYGRFVMGMVLGLVLFLVGWVTLADEYDWDQTYEEAQEEYLEDDWYEEEDDAAATWTDSYECARYKDGWTDESPEPECRRDSVPSEPGAEIVGGADGA